MPPKIFASLIEANFVTKRLPVVPLGNPRATGNFVVDCVTGDSVSRCCRADSEAGDFSEALPPSASRQAVALFRYGFIADLVRLQPGSKGLYARIGQKVGEEYNIPSSTRTRVAAETIRDWLKAYRRARCPAKQPVQANIYALDPPPGLPHLPTLSHRCGQCGKSS